MVKIKYMGSLDDDGDFIEYPTIMSFIIGNAFSKFEILELRFFRDSVLGSEIDTSNTSFLDETEGDFLVVREDVLPNGPGLVPALVSFAVSAVVAMVITNSMRKPDIPNTNDVEVRSATNKLGKRQNDFRVGGRVDDIYGSIKRHVPSLLQEPHVFYENDREIERFLLLIGRGVYRVDGTPRDGDTLITRLPNAKCNIYGPNNNPNVGDSPEYNYGGLISKPVTIVKKSQEIQSQELLPPNEKGLLSQDFLFNGVFISPGVVDLEVLYVGADNSFDFGNEFMVGEYAPITNFAWIGVSGDDNTLGSVTITRTKNQQPESVNVDVLQIGNFSSDKYKVKSITPTLLTLDTSELSAQLRVKLVDVVNYSPDIDVDTFYNLFTYDVLQNGDVKYLNGFITKNPIVKSEDWSWEGNPITRLDILYSQPQLGKRPQIGLLFNNDYGPIRGDRNLKKLWFNLVARNGYYDIKDNNLISLSSDVIAYVEEIDVNGLVTGVNFSKTFIFRTNPKDKTVQSGRSCYIDVPESYYDYQITFRRVTNRAYEEGRSNVDKLYLTELFFYSEPIDMSPFGNVTIADVEIPSSPVATESKKRLFNLDVTRRLRHYQGNGVLTEELSMITDQFDQILINMCLDDKMGNLPLHSFDADNFLLLRNQMIQYYGDDRMCKFGFNFDDSDLSFQDCYAIVLNAVNCIPFTQFGVYTAIFEKSQPTSSMQITHRNKIPGSEKKNIVFDQIYDGISVTYRDEIDGEFSTLVHPENAVKPDRLELNGVTTYIQAKRRLMREYYKLKYIYMYTEFDVDDFGQLIVPGVRIDSTDSTRFTYREGVDDGYRVYDGEILNVNGLVVELSQPVTFTQGERHYIVITKEDGLNSEPVECINTGSQFSVMLSELPTEPIYHGYLRDKTKFIFFSEQLKSSIALTPKTISYNYNDGVETFSVSCVNYDERVYQDDNEEF